ncbi:MAG: phosphogluconate dehydrogenase (NADP(+)-dependent, decarboxylating) [Chloroflexi bacterium RBG_16_54_11]|nr:MAG: phosphogluconate dehydrogenase (NADP(+)-dependent, decarboxylating) [Chloroflexi bacterium RBG_16_54_11]
MSRKPRKAQVGMVGLGVMGRNFLLNMAEHGFSAAGYDKEPAKLSLLHSEAMGLPVQWAGDVKSFLELLEPPRAVILLVPAGPVVDSVIRDLLPQLEIGDLLVDAGNSHFTDTDIRGKTLQAKGVHYMGMGISGGEAGARYGPSLMPGGPQAAYQRIQTILETCAAQVEGEPCVTYLGPGSAGHYVKMVHNGIEYGMMQLIAETYDLLRRGLGLGDGEIGDIFERWSQSDLNSYLVEITADIIRKTDEITGKPLVEVVQDSARQLGTGMWASQDAMELHVPTPTIDTAVAMRNLSALQDIRFAMGGKYGGRIQPNIGKSSDILEHAGRALYAGFILTYAQGFSLMGAASHTYAYQLDLAAVARIWRGGCIIRSSLLEHIRSSFERQPNLLYLLLDEALGEAVDVRLPSLRHIVQVGAEVGLPLPAFMALLASFDSLRSTHLPANLIQAQRDYFGAHTYERVDRRGIFHTEWSKDIGA